MNGKNKPLDGTVDLQGHRGARGLRPENTWPSFEYALDCHVTSIEFDVNVTRDKQLIIHHDSEINAEICLGEDGLPARSVPIRELDLADIKRLDCGAVRNESFPEQTPAPGTRLITLPELFDLVRKYEAGHPSKEPIRFFVEIKFRDGYTSDEIPESAGLVVKAIERAGMVERSSIQCFVTDVHPEIKRLNSALQTSAAFYISREEMKEKALSLAEYQQSILEEALSKGVDIISPHYAHVSPEFVENCHRQGVKVITWTVNRPNRIRELLDFGVDGIISDYPDLLMNVYQAWAAEQR